jgi:serine/threonine-protein kinase
MEPLFRGIQTRRIDRIAAAYAVGGWIVVQAASIALPAFQLPEWSLRAFIIFICAGFPVALALTWFAAPHLGWTGESPKPFAGQRLVGLAVVALVLALSAGEIAYRFANAVPPPPLPAPMPAAPAISAASIAVLPFDNMSGDARKTYFSDGITEEILNDLANVPALRVAARASSFSFRGKTQNIPGIARALAVRTILQGSVRESGQHIRITAALINASNGYLLWSSNYDRDLTNVLDVQEDIARAITVALTHELLPENPATKANRPVAMNPEAYRAYLEGQYDLGPRTADGAAKALALFQKATALQPDFAEGFAALGRAYINVAEDRPQDKTLIPAAKAALARALQLAPDNLNALAVHLDLSLHLLDWDAAMRDADKMQSINANSAVVLHEMFRYYQLFGFPQRALDSASGAAQLDPLSIVDRLNIVAAHIHNAEWAAAASAAEDALSMHHDQPYIQSMLCTAYAHSGRLAEARRIAEAFTAAKDAGDADGCHFDIAVGSGKRSQAVAIVDKLAAQFPNGGLGATDIGDDYAIAGAYAKALTWLNRAYDLQEFAVFTVPFDKAIAPEFLLLPQWDSFWQKPRAKSWQATHGRIAAQLVGG